MKGQVPGAGPLTSAILVAHLPELGQKALTALAGLAPWSRDSGQQCGNRAIRGGRGLVRHQSNVAVVAVLISLRERGKRRSCPGGHAPLLQLNAVARRGTPWVPQVG